MVPAESQREKGKLRSGGGSIEGRTRNFPEGSCLREGTDQPYARTQCQRGGGETELGATSPKAVEYFIKGGKVPKKEEARESASVQEYLNLLGEMTDVF